METVQLQCGHCNQVIAIGVEHLGGQVQCPHCQGVLQTPAREAAPPAPIPEMELSPRASVVAGPESTDVERVESVPPPIVVSDEVPIVVPDEAPIVFHDEAPLAANRERDADAEANAELPKFKPRPVFDRSVVTMYFLIFLVPYAILTTLAVVYFLMQTPTPRIHPFDMLPDPTPNKGGPKKVGSNKFDPLGPLADHQKVALGKHITVGKDGDLEVTAEKIRLTAAGELQLLLRAKNISKNTAFTPIHDFWPRFNPQKSAEIPYTFVETPSGKVKNVYGAILEYRKNLTDDAEGQNSLGPGEETVIALTTMANTIKDQKPFLAAIIAGTETHVWRVQLRRGFVKHNKQDVSATAIIGVEFKTSEIERSKQG